MLQQAFDKAVSLIDAANSEDPNSETIDGKVWPKELCYSYRMSEMLERYKPQADHVTQLAIRGQHIQRWKSPRSDYPMDRKGYHQWRSSLYTFHADSVAALMAEAGYDEESLARVKKAVGKKELKLNEDSQLLEDVASLVFIEHYMLALAEKYPEYKEEKWLDIIRKTWRKMSEDAHMFVISGKVKLPESLVPLVQKAISVNA